MKLFIQASVLVLLGNVTASYSQNPNTAYLGDSAKLQANMAGYWTNLTRLDGAIHSSTFYFRENGLFAGVLSATKGTNARSVTVGGMWAISNNTLVLSDLALTNKQVISKGVPARKSQVFRLVSVSKNSFGVEAPPDSVIKVDLWCRSVSATQLIAKYFSVHEPGVIRKKYSVDRPADTGQMEKRQ